MIYLSFFFGLPLFFIILPYIFYKIISFFIFFGLPLFFISFFLKSQYFYNIGSIKGIFSGVSIIKISHNPES